MEGQYETSDLAFSAFLIYSNERLVGLKRDEYNPKRAIFLFTDSDNINQLRKEFIGRQARVEPLTYTSSIKHLKGMITSDTVNHNDNHN